MRFQESYQRKDTIAAIATPQGSGGISIVRISGPSSVHIADKMFSKDMYSIPSHMMTYGKIIDNNGKDIDNVMVVAMLSGKSYTGENVVEIHCHGNPFITKKILDTTITLGAKISMPGEFTFRAFINGKIDLIQAESVASYITANSNAALNVANSYMSGKFSQHIREIIDSLKTSSAAIESFINFPEECSNTCNYETIKTSLETTITSMQSTLSTFQRGIKIYNGISVCLAGTANAGKSSLMNAILGRERSIVTSIPGTTRDFVEDNCEYNGKNFRIIDTAGFMTSNNLIDTTSMEISKKIMETADIVIVVIDNSKDISDEDKSIVNSIKTKKIIALNKSDICSIKRYVDKEITINISAKTFSGIKELLQAIDDMVYYEQFSQKINNDIIITKTHHAECLKSSIKHCQHAIEAIKNNHPPECLIIDIEKGMQSIGKILGINVDEEILETIFSSFCIGK